MLGVWNACKTAPHRLCIREKTARELRGSAPIDRNRVTARPAAATGPTGLFLDRAHANPPADCRCRDGSAAYLRLAGNVREPEHVIPRARLLATGNEMAPSDLMLRPRGDAAPLLEDMALEQVKRSRPTSLALAGSPGARRPVSERLDHASGGERLG